MASGTDSSWGGLQSIAEAPDDDGGWGGDDDDDLFADEETFDEPLLAQLHPADPATEAAAANEELQLELVNSENLRA